MQPIHAQMLDCRHPSLTNVADRNAARADRLTIRMHGATSAKSGAATEAGASEAEFVAQDPKKRRIGRARTPAADPVDYDFNHHWTPGRQAARDTVRRAAAAKLWARSDGRMTKAVRGGRPLDQACAATQRTRATGVPYCPPPALSPLSAACCAGRR